MKNKNINTIILICLTCFFLISIVSIYSTISLTSLNNDILIKQIIWYVIGFILMLIISKININKIIKFSHIYYILGIIMLILVLFIGKEINGSKCWFIIPGIGSFQPSEFIKIVLILINVKIIDNHNIKYQSKNWKTDFILFFKIMLITIIPSFLTFIEPDTGMVIIYFIISFAMLYIYGIKNRIFIILSILILVFISVFLFIYFNYQDTFINVFGTSFFYRIDRLLDWSNKSGMQLINATSSIKAAGLTGFGISKTPIYIPEAHTDFIFSIFSNNTGFIGSFILILIVIIFDFCITKLINNNKYITTGYLFMILYQQVQNISMNIGLLPITGITLPFISYGGSSLLSYMIGLGLILNNKKA